jgi:hypothetical protein
MNAITFTDEIFKGLQRLVLSAFSLLVASFCSYYLNASIDSTTTWTWIKASFHDNQFTLYDILSRKALNGKHLNGDSVITA